MQVRDTLPQPSVCNDMAAASFPRVTGYQVANGKRSGAVNSVTRPRRSAPPSTKSILVAQGKTVIERASCVFDRIADEILTFNLPRFNMKKPGMVAVAGAAAVGLSATVLAVMTQGVRSQAEAATINYSIAGISALPSSRERVVISASANLREALTNAAVAPGDIDRVIAETANAGAGDKLPIGTSVDLIFSGRTADGAYRSLHAAELRPRLDLELTLRRTDGQLRPHVRKLAVDSTPLRLYGAVSKDVRKDMVALGIPAGNVDQYLRLMDDHVDVDTIKRGDRYDVVVEQWKSETGEVVIGNLLYAGLYQKNGVDLRLSQWTKNNKLRWYDAREASQSSDNLQRPVPGTVSSNYGMRIHPILGYGRMHRGMDFKAGYGTPILAVQTGYIEYAGWRGGYGKHVELKHGGGLSTTYSHMSKIVVSNNQLVQQGQVIGYVGSTGLSTGPHLHYELLKNGVAIDPGTVQFTTGPKLRGSDLEGYEKRLRALLAIPVGKAPDPRLLRA